MRRFHHAFIDAGLALRFESLGRAPSSMVGDLSGPTSLAAIGRRKVPHAKGSLVIRSVFDGYANGRIRSYGALTGSRQPFRPRLWTRGGYGRCTETEDPTTILMRSSPTTSGPEYVSRVRAIS